MASLQGDTLQTLYLETPTYSPLGVPSQTLYLGSNVHSLQGDPTFQTLYVGSHLHNLQGDPTFHTMHLGSHIQFPG